MKKITIFIITIIFAISLIFLISTLSINSQKESQLNEVKSINKNTKTNIKNLESQTQQNSVLLNKIEKDPNKLVDEAKGTVNDFVKVIKDNEGKSDSDKNKAFKNNLKNIVNEDVLDSPELTSISIPESSEVEVATYRGESIPVLIGNKDKYIIATYDTFSESITSIREYKKAD